jgi:hypothetical protein
VTEEMMRIVLATEFDPKLLGPDPGSREGGRR